MLRSHWCCCGLGFVLLCALGPVRVVLVHGMGACHEHWNKLLGELDTNHYTAYALDLLGFGDSDKPVPQLESVERGHLYSYNTWSQQIRDFVDQVGACGH